MNKEKAHIIAMKNGTPIGYIKSVSYTRQKFSMTQSKMEAKGYTKIDAIHDDIDFLTKLAAHLGYVFIYD